MELKTRKGTIQFPTYIPVSTDGVKYPLDKLIYPYLPRIAPAILISEFYTRQLESPPSIPLWVDSGGYVSLFKNAKVRTRKGLGVIELDLGEGQTDWLTPQTILRRQEEVADVAFPLDFPIPLGMSPKEAQKRHNLTQHNAVWALANCRRRDLPIYAPLQGWDINSYIQCLSYYEDEGFAGYGIGGIVPRLKDLEFVYELVKTIRCRTEKPLHVFGVGKPEIVKALFDLGVNSVDSSSYLKAAADGILWSNSQLKHKDCSVIERLHLAILNLTWANQIALPLSSHAKFSSL